MPGTPFSGHVPLNLRRGDKDTIEKSTSFKPGKVHPVFYRDQYSDKTLDTRNPGCTVLRRYPNGMLDIEYVCGQVIELYHKAKHGGKLTQYEQAVLSIILPGPFGKLVDSKIAHTMTKMSQEEKLLVALQVRRHLNEELNYNAGRGGGSVPNRSTTVV